ncbi:MAG: AAA family ATPase [Vicinamibacterales bacterium]
MTRRVDRSGDGARDVVLRLLGRFEIRIDGRPVAATWRSRRARELVQLLALTPGLALPCDQVIDLLWPRLDAVAGRANLRKAAHHARHSIGVPAAIELQLDRVRLFPDTQVRSDVGEFEEAAAAALASRDAGLARAAAAHYTGELLSEARYESWAADAGRRLHDKYLELLRLSEQWGELLAREPTDETACQQLMRQYLAGGQRHRAIACYGRLRAALQHELGLRPNGETQRLYAECLAGLTSRSTVFVGRAAELATIDAVLAPGAARRSVLWFRGPGGIGKTALCAELAARAGTAGWSTLAVSGVEGEDPYATLAGLAERLLAADPARLARVSARSRSVLAVLTPAVRPADPLETTLTRHQVVGAMQQLIDASAAGPGLVIVVDEAQSVDPLSLGAIGQLGDRLATRLVLALASRPGTTADRVRQCALAAARDQPPVVLDLAPLEREDVRVLAGATAGRLSDAELDALVSQSDGFPFLVLELARLGPPFHGAHVRSSVREAVGQRLSAFDPDMLAWLRRLALVGGLLEWPRVIAIAGCCEADATRLLDAALAAGVLQVDEGAYRFRHELVRDALAEDVPPHHRVAIHRDAARRLIGFGARPAVIARHWVQGGRADEAVGWFVRAATDALKVGGYAAAIELSDSALEHAPDRLDALLCRARALDALGDPRALPAYARAEDVARPEERQEIVPLRALAQIKQGDPAGAIRVLDGVRPSGLEARLAQALTWSGAALLGATDPDIGSRLSAEGRRLALASGDPGSVIVASWAQAAAAHARGELRDSLWADLRDTSVLPRLAVTVFDGQLCITQRLLYGDRPYDDVIGFATAFEAESRRLGAARGAAFGRTLRGEAELLSGRLEDADADLREAGRMHRAMHAPTGTAFALQRRSEVLFQRGDLAGAAALLDEALAIARESDVGFHLFDRIYGTRIWLALEGDAGRAAQVAREACDLVQGPVETCPGCRITLAVPAAIAAARAGDLERLDALMPACEFLATTVMHLPGWYAALDEVRAHGCLARGDRDDAARHFAAAASRFAAVGQPLDAARCERWRDTMVSSARSTASPGHV